MKKIVPLLLALSISLWSADFWQTKPYTDWSDKEAQRIETNSPWAKEVSVSLGVGPGGPDTGRGKRGGNGSTGDIDSSTGGSSTGGRGNMQGAGATHSEASVTVIVSWRTALPIREAVAKTKFGAEASTSAEAKKLVEEQQNFYMIMVSGFPATVFRGNDKLKESLLRNTSLLVKGKDPIQASDVKTGGNEQKGVVLFLFPKTAPFSLDDKDVEFSTKLGPILVKQKFHLKDMVFNGKLDL
jgi:hypothetical protein